MNYPKPVFLFDKYRPGELAPLGDFFLKIKSPCGSIFLPFEGIAC
jgi:hypothetical protein